MTFQHSDHAGTVLDEALLAVLYFRGESQALRHRIAEVEFAIAGLMPDRAIEAAGLLGVTPDLLAGALLVKEAAAQIDVILHAAGIVASIPYILEPEERIEYVSLGAGNTGRAHDLETDRQVAEFKFIHWHGGAESVRQDSLLIDLFHLAVSQTTKARRIYLTGIAVPMRFLEGSRRDLRTALARRPGVPEQFNKVYGDNFVTVRDYWAAIRDQVEVIDLESLVPTLLRT